MPWRPCFNACSARSRSNRHRRQLATAYSHAALGEEAVSLATKLEFRRVVFGWLDESLGN